jgi:hypothetical protein
MSAASGEGAEIVRDAGQELGRAVAHLHEATANLLRVGILSSGLDPGLGEWSDRDEVTR